MQRFEVADLGMDGGEVGHVDIGLGCGCRVRGEVNTGPRDDKDTGGLCVGRSSRARRKRIAREGRRNAFRRQVAMVRRWRLLLCGITVETTSIGANLSLRSVAAGHSKAPELERPQGVKALAVIEADTVDRQEHSIGGTPEGWTPCKIALPRMLVPFLNDAFPCRTGHPYGLTPVASRSTSFGGPRATRQPPSRLRA